MPTDSSLTAIYVIPQMDPVLYSCKMTFSAVLINVGNLVYLVLLNKVRYSHLRYITYVILE